MRGPFLLLLLAVALACGPDKGPLNWIDARAAVVHCTSAGRDRMPPVLQGLPMPSPPSGLYARGLDPMALNSLGFERDTVACAMLLAPEPARSQETATALTELVAVRKTAGREAARQAGRCVCEAADAVDLRQLIPSCVRRSVRASCKDDSGVSKVRAALEPVLAQLAASPLPLLHWRLVGHTDRPGWFADHWGELLANHSGGSLVYVRGQSVPLRHNAELLRALLDGDNVVAVVRQDAGRAVLVVREVGSELILDHFRYAAVHSDNVALLSFMDNARIEEYRQRLAQPTAVRKLIFEPSGGNVVEVNRALLDQVDDLVYASAALMKQTPQEMRVARADKLLEPLVDAVAVQASFGKEGTQLRAKLILNERGRSWASGLSSQLLTPGLEELGAQLELPDTPRAKVDGTHFVLARSPAQYFVFEAVQRSPALLREIELTHPSTIQGRAHQWRIELPQVDLAGFVGRQAPAAGLRARFAQEPYVVETSFDAARETMEVVFKPR